MWRVSVVVGVVSDVVNAYIIASCMIPYKVHNFESSASMNKMAEAML